RSASPYASHLVRLATERCATGRATPALVFPRFFTLGVPFCPEVVSNACLKSNGRLKSEGIVKSFVRKFAVKFIEMAGAGLASALCAYVLGQIERAPAPTPMPAVVYISPANVDTALREDHTRPAAIARTDAETQPEAAASAPAATAPKAVKPAAVAQARRN